MKSKIKSFFKRFAPLAVMVLMLCTMTVTAFAAEAEIPDGWTVLDNGESVTFTASPQVKQLIPVTEGTTYVFAGDSKYGVFMGVKADGTTETIGRANEMDNAYTADGTYQWITISCYNVSSVTGSVTWPEPTIMDNVGTFVSTFLTDIGGPVIQFVVTNPICLLPFILGFIVLGYGLIKRLVYGL